MKMIELMELRNRELMKILKQQRDVFKYPSARAAPSAYSGISIDVHTNNVSFFDQCQPPGWMRTEP